MKKILLLICTAMIFTTAFINHNFKSGIYGSIDPPDGAKRVWAISGRDSVSVVPATGKFSIELKAGTWKVFVEARDANKNTSIENIVVLDNQFTDVGVIKLP
jgi:uncharacterized GH25 family protein